MFGAVVFALAGILLLFLGVKLKKDKNIDNLSPMTEERKKKIKHIDKVVSDFSSGYIMLAIACFITSVGTYFFARVGTIIGMIFIIIAAMKWSNINSSIDEKIRRREY